jgi:hypothetical protein
MWVNQDYYFYCNLVFFIGRYNDRSLTQLEQFFLIPNRINMLLDLTMNSPTSFSNTVYWKLANTS